MSRLDPLRPYLGALCAVGLALALVAVVTFAFTAGANRERANAGDRLAKMTAARDAWRSSAGQWRAIVRQQQADNTARIEAADKAKRDAEKAGAAARAAEAQAKAAEARFDRQVQDARRKPSCAALLDMDITKECGL